MRAAKRSRPGSLADGRIRAVHSDGAMNSPFHWVEFNIFVLIAVALDLFLFHRRPQKIGLREALAWSGAGIGVAVLLGGGQLPHHSANRRAALVTRILDEKTLVVVHPI